MMEQPMDHDDDASPYEADEAAADAPRAAMLEELNELPDGLALPSPDPASGSPAPTGGIDDLAAMFDVPVRVQAVLGRARMPIGDLLRMKSGMVIELDRKVGEPADIFVNDRLIARGEVVLIDDSLGITLTEIVQREC